MQEFGITKSVVMGPPRPPPGAFDASDFIPALRRYSDRFVFLGGGGILNPCCTRTATRKAFTEFETVRAVDCSRYRYWRDRDMA